MSNPQNKPKKDIEVVARKLASIIDSDPHGVYYKNYRQYPIWHLYKPEARQILLALKRNGNRSK